MKLRRMKIPLIVFLAVLHYPVALRGSSVYKPAVCDVSGKNDGRICELKHRSGVCYGKTCFVSSPNTRQVLIKMRYNKSNPYIVSSKLSSSTMWLRGNGFGLIWEKGKQMKQSNLEKDTWEFPLNFTITVPTSEKHEKQPVKLEFRVYLDDTKDMLGANFALSLPPSSGTEHLSDWKDVPVFWVYPWFFQTKGNTTKRTIFSPELNQNRKIIIYTPASFHENGYKKYETLFFNDGQVLRYLLPQIDNMVVQKPVLREFVIIGLVNNQTERTQLLVPSNGTTAQCKRGNGSNRCDNCVRCYGEKTCNDTELIMDYNCFRWIPFEKAYGERYLDFIQNTLIPESQKSYKAAIGTVNVGIIGYSLGGLISCHAMWTRPDTFGSAACMSPSFWWPIPENATIPDDIIYEFVKSTLNKFRGARPRQKVYIDVGSREGNTMVDPARNVSRILANSPYFEINKNLWFYIWEKHDHDFRKAFVRIWFPLLALYGEDGSMGPGTSSSITSTSGSASLNAKVSSHEKYYLVLISCAFIAFLQKV